jgi:hypothetical protein
VESLPKFQKRKMTTDELESAFEAHEDESLNFERVIKYYGTNRRADLHRSNMTRDYYGLPVRIISEHPQIVKDWAQSASRGDYDVGRLGLTVTIVDSDPYYCGVIYQNGALIASVNCLPNKTGLVNSLAQDDIAKLVSVFQIRTDL